MAYQTSLQVIVSSFPSIRSDNPYLNLCQKAAEEQGVEYDRSGDDYLDWRWLVSNRRRVRVLHLHWTQYHYVRRTRGASIAAFARFAIKLVLARILRYRIVWTMHNVLPHEPSSPPVLDHLGRLLVARVATSVIVHCKCAQELLARRFHRKREVYVVPHPNYCDVLSGAGSREEARAKLGLEHESKVLLFFGSIRPYKGLTDLLAAFRELPDADLALIIAGKPASSEIEAEIVSLIAGDTRVVTNLAYVSDEQLEMYLCASNVAVFPFRGVLTSGSVIFALSAGRPVVAPAMGCLPELLTPECGILYDPADARGLRNALLRCSELDLDAMGREARRRAGQFTAKSVALETLKAYQAGENRA
jgi:glycosyltransferase involved in cell wall biosynthesis